MGNPVAGLREDRPGTPPRGSAASVYASRWKTLHLGLGSAASADRIVVRWPSRGVDVLANVPADQYVTLVEGATGVLSFDDLEAGDLSGWSGARP